MPMLLGVLKGLAGFAGGFSSISATGGGPGAGSRVTVGVSAVVGRGVASCVAAGGGVLVLLVLLLPPAPIVKLFKLTLFFS